ncbi:MAG: NFACT RNA binding domain-containing protein [Candidatus Woesearchaeota archaeon]
MEIRLNYKKSINENVNDIYEEIKKLKSKIQGAEEAIKEMQEKINKREIELKSKKEKILRERKFWFEKFHWFITNKGHLFIAGKDATSNEIIIKKHLDSEDLVFHTLTPGSPFGILKLKEKIENYFPEIYETLKNKESEINELEECAIFVSSFSKLWKSEFTVSDAFYVKPEQVSKKAPSGEYLSKGSFMIYGEKNIINVELGLGITLINDVLMIAPIKTTIFFSELFNTDYVLIKKGNKRKYIEAIKLIAKFFNVHENEVQRIMPSGNCDLSFFKRERSSDQKNKTED